MGSAAGVFEVGIRFSETSKLLFNETYKKGATLSVCVTYRRKELHCKYFQSLDFFSYGSQAEALPPSTDCPGVPISARS